MTCIAEVYRSHDQHIQRFGPPTWVDLHPITWLRLVRCSGLPKSGAWLLLGARVRLTPAVEIGRVRWRPLRADA